MFDKIEIYVTIVSAIIIGVINIFNNVTFIEMLTSFILVIIVSYTLTLLLKLYIKKFIIFEEKEDSVTNDVSIESQQATQNIEDNPLDDIEKDTNEQIKDQEKI